MVEKGTGYYWIIRGKKNVDAIAIEILTNMNATMTTIMKLSGKEPSNMRVEILE